jgi:hypothetical protein
MRKHPKNVQAVLDWYSEHRPDMLAQIEKIFQLPPEGRAPTIFELDTQRCMEPFQALLLQGFEAGREFERKYPGVDFLGYMEE